ncbi:MAG: SUMF1/EgtB/PvdO family nonheme iron enzyme [Ignavibacteria bacterium]|nr:SUMF1/EgtB/PvdO family nonheme iron enzyme [Ignavibacteria bacterium]
MIQTILKMVTLFAVSIFMVFIQGCASVDNPVQVLPSGSIQVVTTADAKCILYKSSDIVSEWTGSKLIPGLAEGTYKVKITSDKFNSSFEESFELGVNQKKVVETATGSLDIRLKSDFTWEVTKDNKSLFSGKGSLKIDTIWTGAYKVKLGVPGVPDFLTRDITVSKAQNFILEMESGKLDVRIPSTMEAVLSLNDSTELYRWNGRRIIDSLWAGAYQIRIKVHPLVPDYTTNITIVKQQTKVVELDYAKLDVRARNQMECVLFRGTTELDRWYGSRRFDSLWVGDYSVKIKANPLLPEYSTSFTLIKQQVKVIELDYGTLDIRVPGQMECVLLRGTTELERWNGSRKYDSLWIGDYTVKIKVNPLLPEYSTSFTLAKQQTKVVELEYGKLDVRVQSQMQCVLLRGTTEVERWNGSRLFDSLWVGDYTVKVKVNALLPDYVSNVTIVKLQTKTVEPPIGSFTIKTKSDYKNTLLMDGVEQHAWSGTKDFNPWLAGSYTLKSQMFAGAPAPSTNFTINQNENRIIEWETGSINVIAPGSTCKLKRDLVDQFAWQDSRLLDSLITGYYTVEIQEPNSPLWFGDFNLIKDEQKTVSIPYGSVQITSNISTTVTKLIYNGTTLKTLSGNGTISNIVPGNYTLKVEAPDYLSQTENITVISGQNQPRSYELQQDYSQMVFIPGGTFTMGCTADQGICLDNERPSHQVTLSAYEIRKFEVNQKEWLAVMGTNPANFIGNSKPIESVTWYEIINFCNLLSTREGLTPVYTINGLVVTANLSANGYRLPTEAEWEYAARGGAQSTNTLYSGSNNIDAVAWYSGNSNNTTHDAGEKSPNQLGIYGMNGNVWEWCWDWYGDYSAASQTNPTGPETGTHRVARGGSWSSSAQYSRVAVRYNFAPNLKYDFLGFRVVRTR